MRASPMVPRRRAVLAFAVMLAMALATAGQAMAGGGRGAVYVQTNTVPNYVQVFERAADGTLTLGARYATGGDGQPVNPPFGFPVLDSQGSVELTDNGRLLFAVNGGDNTVSSFRVRPDGLELADRERTLGLHPISATTYNGSLLYVLNEGFASAASISGYTLSSKGEMTPIPGSVQPTSDPAGVPGQVEFSARGDVLAVTERLAPGTGLLTTYAVGVTGAAGPPMAHPSTGPIPFGMAFDQRDRLIVSNAGVPTSASSYDVSRSGAVTPLDLEATNADSSCWVVITNNGKLTYLTSPLTLSVEGFHIETDGTLTPVTATSRVAQLTGLTLDAALSHDSRYLYVLVNDFFAGSRIEAFAVGPGGTLTPLGSTASFEASASGLAAW
jgi:6-phosphogluconolactonase